MCNATVTNKSQRSVNVLTAEYFVFEAFFQRTMKVQRSYCVQRARTRSAKIVQETCLSLVVVEDPRSFVNVGRHGLLDGRHLSGRKHRILEDLSLKVYEQLFDGWVDVRSPVFVGTVCLRVGLFCRDIRLRTRDYLYVWSRRFVLVDPFIVRATFGTALDGCRCWICGQPQPLKHFGTAPSDWKIKILQAKAKNFTGKILEIVCSRGLRRLRM